MPRNNYEEQEQREVVKFLTLAGVRFCHVPNGGKRGRIEAAIFKGLGVQAGVPDLLIFDPPPFHVSRYDRQPRYIGTAIEMKARKDQVPGAKPTQAQRQWLDALRERGWFTAVCYGAGEAIDLLRGVGYGEVRRHDTQRTHSEPAPPR